VNIKKGTLFYLHITSGLLLSGPHINKKTKKKNTKRQKKYSKKIKKIYQLEEYTKIHRKLPKTG
jgi:hypothetical protein